MIRTILAALALSLVVTFAVEHFRPAPVTPQQTAAKPAPQAQRPDAPQPRVERREPAQPAGLRFQRLVTDTSKDAPSACLEFTQPLSAGSDVNYADYITLEPATRVALKATENRLCIDGLVFGREYKVALKPGLPGAGDQRLVDGETVPVSFVERPPFVAFVGNGFILPRHGSIGLPVETVNVEKVRIKVSRVGDRILSRAQFGQASSGYYDQLYETREVSVPLWSGEMTVNGRRNERVVTTLPLSDVIKPRRPGAYLVTAENAAGADDENQRYRRAPKATQWVLDTDMALTTLRGADGLHVFLRSIETAKPIANAKLALIATNNDELGTVVTDANGRGQFAPGLMRGTGPLVPKMVMAYGAEEDFAVLDLARPAFDLSDRGVGGRPAPGPVDAYLYTERGVYRPGEAVEIMALLRDRLGDAIDNAPLSLLIQRPDGVEARRMRFEPQPAGGFHTTYELSRAAARGMWTATASLDGAGQNVGRVQFEVADFVPQKLKVTLTSPMSEIKPGEKLALALESRFLYGAPAADLGTEGELQLKVDDAPFPAFKGWRFGLTTEKFKEEIIPLELDDTDENGKVAAEIDPPKIARTSLPLKAIVTAGVFEPGGRVTKDQISLPIRNQPLSIGIRPRFDGDRVPEGSAAGFEVIALDASGARVARQGLGWRVVAENWSYGWFFTEDSGWRYQQIAKESTFATGTLDIAADKPAEVSQAIAWGRYRLIVTDPQSGAATSVRFASGWDVAGAERDTPDTVQVAALTERVKPGQNARVLVKAPFAGELQITVATDRVLETRSLSVAAGDATIELTADPQWGNGAYVLASLYRPRAAVKAHEPTRAIGLVWIATDISDRTLAVKLTTPDLTRPRTTFEVPVKVEGMAAGDTAYVTVAAVDEGILQLTRFVSPDPTAHYFSKRRLGVDIRDDYARLLDGNAGPAGALRQGGDSPGGMGLSVVPTRTLALFSGPVAVDASGQARVSLPLPEFNGQIRVMAVAYNKRAVGRAEAAVTVRDPLVAELILPRFLAPGDQAAATMLLHNVELAAGTFRVALKTRGAVSLANDGAFDVELGAGVRKTLPIQVAGGEPGIGRFELEVTGPAGFKATRDWNIEVRTPRRPITFEQTALQKPGEPYRPDPTMLDAFIPGSGRMSLNYSTLKGIDVPGLLQSLDRYPFGCSEQLVSRAMPLVVSDLGARDAELRVRVQSAIDTMIERQGRDGTFGLWREGDEAVQPFLGAYIADFLARAKERGFVVADLAMERAYRAIASMSQGGRLYDSAYNTVPANDEALQLEGAAYAHYILARAKRAEIGDLRYFHDNKLPRVQSPIAAAQVGTALALMGDRARAVSAFRKATETIGNRPLSYYATPLRDTAGVVAMAAEAQQAALLPDLVARLGRYDTRAERTHTQEKAWLLMAAQAMMSSAGPLQIAVNDNAAATSARPVSFSPDPQDVARGYVLTNRGQGDAWRTVVAHGVPKLPQGAMSAGMDIRKLLFTLDGEAVDPAEVKQNDRIVVAISGAVKDQAYHQSILVDMLPAGWEIETVLSRNEDGKAAGFEFLSLLSSVRMREARDDRFVVAIDLKRETRRSGHSDPSELPPGEFNVAYIARAVTPGSFALPAAQIEDMYRPDVMARTEEGTTTVEGR